MVKYFKRDFRKGIDKELLTGVMTIEEDKPLELKITFDGKHQINISFDKYEIEQLKKSLSTSKKEGTELS